eukprot:9637096-Karenia_brevis.AAC.1
MSPRWADACVLCQACFEEACIRGCTLLWPIMASKFANPPPDARTFGYSCSPDARIRGRMRAF